MNHARRSPGTERRFAIASLVVTASLVLAASAVAASAVAASPVAVPTAGAASPSTQLRCEAASPRHRVALVELFTSEGCSSCPPADRWLSALHGAGYGLDRVVALALHVDYWDYIGWKDRFANPAYTSRQRAYARTLGSGTIYTPQVVLDGRDYRGWHAPGGFARSVDAITRQPAPLALELRARRAEGEVEVDLKVEGGASTGSGAALVLALFEDRITSQVTRGENRGETLRHDRVVRGWHEVAPAAAGEPRAAVGTRHASARIRLPDDAIAAHLGVAAFAQARDGSVIQATACRFGG